MAARSASNGTTKPRTTKPRGKTNPRDYVILEEQLLEGDDEPVYQKVHVVEARNATNARRAGFRELRQLGKVGEEARLVAIAASVWRPTTMRANTRETISEG